jgi:hypothetical protein
LSSQPDQCHKDFPRLGREAEYSAKSLGEKRLFHLTNQRFLHKRGRFSPLAFLQAAEQFQDNILKREKIYRKIIKIFNLIIHT